LEINQEAIKKNVQVIREKIGSEVGLMAVVKANAYGHGAVGFAKLSEDLVDRFGVSSVYEAAELRRAGVRLPIVILGYTPPENFDDIVKNSLTATIKNLDVAKALVSAARRQGKTVKVWVKVDSGMHRLGLEPDQVLYFVKKLKDLPNLEVEGIFTHFADVDGDTDFTDWQLANFKRVTQELEAESVDIPIKSAGASGAVFNRPDAYFNMVRTGLSMYGINPSSQVTWSKDLLPVLEFKTEVTQIHELNHGESVGYGRAFRTKRPTRIATLAVGYGDGFRRAPYNWGEVLIAGHRVPLAGRVSMDQAAVDITDVPKDIRVGEGVVLIGRSGKEQIRVEDVADKLQTSPYEVLVGLTARVTRIYK
jgi:alanine racemase